MVAVSASLAVAFSRWARSPTQQNEQRKRTIVELAEANRALEASMEENAGLHAQLLAQAREAGVLDERQRMAGEIHDTLAQGLTGIVTQLEAAEQAGRRAAPLAPPPRLAAEPGPGQPDRGPPLGAGARPGAAGGRAACPTRWPSVAERWSELTAIAAEVTTTGTGRAAAPRGRGGPAPDRAGGAGQRGQARRRRPGRPDAVLHGRRGHARRARRRASASTPRAAATARPTAAVTGCRDAPADRRGSPAPWRSRPSPARARPCSARRPGASRAEVAGERGRAGSGC